MRHYLTKIIILALSSLGCAPTLSEARAAANSVQMLYEQTKGPLEQRYQDDQLQCLEQRPVPPEPCVTSVRRSWQAVKEAEITFYRSVLLAQSVVGTAEAAAAVGRKPSVLQVMAVVSSAVDAGERLRDAVQALHQGGDPVPVAPARKPSPWVPWPGPPVPADKPGGPS